jgi:hypothetical protein
MDFVEDAKALLNLVRTALQAPTLQALAELRPRVPQLLQALEPPRPNAADAERVRTRATGVDAVSRLSDAELTLARQLSERLRTNELVAARLVAATKARRGSKPSFSCVRAWLTPLPRLRRSFRQSRMKSDCWMPSACMKRCANARASVRQATRLTPATRLCVRAQARWYQVKALHDLLLRRTAAAIPTEDVDEQTLVAFFRVRFLASRICPRVARLKRVPALPACQDLLAAQVGGKTLLEHLASLASASDRMPHAAGALLLTNGGTSQGGTHDVTPVVTPARGDAAGQVQVLLAECLFFASSLRERVGQTELASMLSALDAITHGRAEPALVCADSRAVAILFAVLAALDSGKVAAAELEALQAGAQFVPSAKHDQVTALLRLAFGLCSAASSEAALKPACDDGALQYLLTVVNSPAFALGTHDWPDAYVVPAHDLVAGFLQDTRAHGGRFQVKCMREAKHAGFAQLIQLLASLYDQGSEDLPLECKPLWDFVDYAIEEYFAERSPTTLMPLLQLLRSLPVSQAAQAHKVWSRLHSIALGVAAPGDLICGAMLSYCKLYAGDEFSTSLAQPRSLFQDENSLPVREVNIPNEDVDAMLGYLRLLQQLMETAPRDFATDRVQQLEIKCFEGKPIMFVLFTLLDLPVQPKLKAALFNVIGSFASELASAEKIWRFLQDAAVRSKPVETGFYDMQHLQDLGTSVPRADILYELNEVEARAETYVETLAFISLVNKLLDLCECTNRGPAAGGGGAALHIFHFVRDAVFLKMDRRAYKSATEKWLLTKACLEHFRLAIRLAQGTPPEFMDQGLASPGQELLQDFENDGPVLRSALGLLHGGAGYLEEEREHAHGLALESCIGEAFTVLHAALPVKASGVASHGLPRSSNFDALLLRDRRRLVQLFSFVGYTQNAALQALVVQVVHNLALRNERLLPMALDLATLQHLKKCVVDALRQGLEAELTPGGTALVVCRMLVEILPQQVTPNLAQLLLGFELTPEGGLALSPFRHEACLALLMSAVQAPWCATDGLGTLLLRESVFHIFYTLAADSRTRTPAVAHLREELQLSAHLMGLTPRPETTSAEQTSLLHQRAWILRLAAVILHHASEAGDSTALDSGLLQSLAVAPSETASRTPAPLLQLLDCAAAVSMNPPLLDSSYAHVVDALRLGNVLSSNGLVEDTELYSRNERGELALNFIALDALLRQRAAEQQCVSATALLLPARVLTPAAFSHLQAAAGWHVLCCGTSPCAASEQLARGT